METINEQVLEKLDAWRTIMNEIEKQIMKLADMMENKMAVTIYANKTWKQIGGEQLQCKQNMNIKKIMDSNSKYSMAEEIVLLRKALNSDVNVAVDDGGKK